jgi:hypothetical protein
MRVDFELPEVAEEKKPQLIQQATKWEPCNISTSVGLRFRRLLKLIELVENGKTLLAEAIFRYDQYVEWAEIDADEEMVEKWMTAADPPSFLDGGDEERN